MTGRATPDQTPVSVTSESKREASEMRNDHNTVSTPPHPVEEAVALTPERIAELRKIAEGASPGPWCMERCGEKEDAPVVGIAYGPDDLDCKNPLSGVLRLCDDDGREIDYYREAIAYEIQAVDGSSASANALHIATFNPAFVLALLSVLKRQKEALERIAAANPRSTNSVCAAEMATWTRAVARKALNKEPSHG